MRTDKPRLLLLHGTLSSRVVWRRLRRELGGDVTCIAPDLPGYGSSRWSGGELTLEALVDGLGPLVERERPTHVVGHSMGGIVALALAGQHPGQFERAGIIGLPVYEDRQQALEFLGRRGRVVRMFLRSDRASHVACMGAAATFPVWQPWVRRRLPMFPRAILRSAFEHGAPAHRAFETIVFAGHVDELAGNLEVPVAALHGTADRAAPVDEVSRIARTWGWQLTVEQDANHQVVFERPQFTANWIRDQVLVRTELAEMGLAAAGG